MATIAPIPQGSVVRACQKIVITGREREAILEALLTPRYHYGGPRIVVQDVVHNALYLEHLDRDATFLDRRYANQTLAYMAELWRHPVHLLTRDESGGEVTLVAQPP